MEGTFTITIDASYQLHFRQSIDNLLKTLSKLLSADQYEDVENNIVYYDHDTGIVSVRTTMTVIADVTVDESECFQDPDYFDRSYGQWYPGDYNDEPSVKYDADGIINDIKYELEKMDTVGNVSIQINSVQTVDYETELDDKYVGEL